MGRVWPRCKFSTHDTAKRLGKPDGCFRHCDRLWGSPGEINGGLSSVHCGSRACGARWASAAERSDVYHNRGTGGSLPRALASRGQWLQSALVCRFCWCCFMRGNTPYCVRPRLDSSTVNPEQNKSAHTSTVAGFVAGPSTRMCLYILRLVAPPTGLPCRNVLGPVRCRRVSHVLLILPSGQVFKHAGSSPVRRLPGGQVLEFRTG